MKGIGPISSGWIKSPSGGQAPVVAAADEAADTDEDEAINEVVEFAKAS